MEDLKNLKKIHGPSDVIAVIIERLTARIANGFQSSEMNDPINSQLRK